MKHVNKILSFPLICLFLMMGFRCLVYAEDSQDVWFPPEAVDACQGKAG